MKKIIIALSGLVMLAFVLVLFVNATNGPKEGKKAGTEMSKDCAKSPVASECAKTADTKSAEAANCDQAKLTEGKSDPAKCKATCANGKDELKKSDAAISSVDTKK